MKMQCIERDGLVRPRHDRREDAVADDRVGERETRCVEEPREALIELVELARGNGKAAMMQKLAVPLEPQASAVSVLGRAKKPGGDEAIAVDGERSARRPMRD